MLKVRDLSCNNSLILIFIYVPSAHNVIKDDIVFENKISQKYLKNMSKIQIKVFSETPIKNDLNCLNTKKYLHDYIKKNNKLARFPSNLHLTAIVHEVIGETT